MLDREKFVSEFRSLLERHNLAFGVVTLGQEADGDLLVIGLSMRHPACITKDILVPAIGKAVTKVQPVIRSAVERDTWGKVHECN